MGGIINNGEVMNVFCKTPRDDAASRAIAQGEAIRKLNRKAKADMAAIHADVLRLETEMLRRALDVIPIARQMLVAIEAAVDLHALAPADYEDMANGMRPLATPCNTLRAHIAEHNAAVNVAAGTGQITVLQAAEYMVTF